MGADRTDPTRAKEVHSKGPQESPNATPKEPRLTVARFPNKAHRGLLGACTPYFGVQDWRAAGTIEGGKVIVGLSVVGRCVCQFCRRLSSTHTGTSVHVYLSVSIYPPICMSNSIYLSICLSVCLSIYISVYPSICLSIYLSIHLSIYIYLPLLFPLFASFFLMYSLICVVTQLFLYMLVA